MRKRNWNAFHLFLLFLILLANNIFFVQAEEKSLNGRNIQVLPLGLIPVAIVEKNATGHIVKLSGVSVLALEWISERLDFTYTVLQDDVNQMEDTPGRIGAITYLRQGKADLIITSAALTNARYKQMDFPYAFLVSPLGVLIPMPRPSDDVEAVWKPLQPTVWIYLIVFLTIIIFIAYTKYFKLLHVGNDSFHYFREWMVNSIIAILSSQPAGGISRYKTMKIRLFLGVWCLGLLVLGRAYSSVLISLITSPIYRPLINSIEEIPEMVGVRVTVHKGKGPDVYFRDSETGIGKFIGDMLRKEPGLRCDKESQCLDRVRKGSYIYIQRPEIILDMIGRDYQLTGRCDFALASKRFSSYHSTFFPMTKNGPYSRQFTKELMNADAIGLFKLWWRIGTCDPTRCLNQSRNRNVAIGPLTLGNLSGAFVVLGIGYALSLLSIILELFYRIYELTRMPNIMVS